MVSALDSGSSGRHSIPGREQGKTLDSLGASLHPGVSVATGKFNAGITLRWTIDPSRGE